MLFRIRTDAFQVVLCCVLFTTVSAEWMRWLSSIPVSANVIKKQKQNKTMNTKPVLQWHVTFNCYHLHNIIKGLIKYITNDHIMSSLAVEDKSWRFSVQNIYVHTKGNKIYLRAKTGLIYNLPYILKGSCLGTSAIHLQNRKLIIISPRWAHISSQHV